MHFKLNPEYNQTISNVYLLRCESQSAEKAVTLV